LEQRRRFAPPLLRFRAEPLQQRPVACGRIGMEEDENQFRAARLEKLDALRAQAIEPYPYSFARTAEAKALESRHVGLAPDASAPSATAACSSTFTTPPARFRSSATRTS
jgi:lysyl-tRNA synthetase class II